MYPETVNTKLGENVNSYVSLYLLYITVQTQVSSITILKTELLLS